MTPKAKKESKEAVEKKPAPQVSESSSSGNVRGRKRERQGVVVSTKMQKTVIVEVIRLFRHPLYGKVMKEKIRIPAHDEKSVAKLGDTVRLVETRPISKTKRWKIVEVVKS